MKAREGCSSRCLTFHPRPSLQPFISSPFIPSSSLCNTEASLCSGLVCARWPGNSCIAVVTRTTLSVSPCDFMKDWLTEIGRGWAGWGRWDCGNGGRRADEEEGGGDGRTFQAPRGACDVFSRHKARINAGQCIITVTLCALGEADCCLREGCMMRSPSSVQAGSRPLTRSVSAALNSVCQGYLWRGGMHDNKGRMLISSVHLCADVQVRWSCLFVPTLEPHPQSN